MNTAFIIGSTAATIYIDGNSFTFPSTHPNFEKAIQAVKDEDFAAIPGLIDLPGTIAKYGQGHIEVRNGAVFYKGEILGGFVVNKLLEMQSQGFNIEPMVLFLEKLQENPSFRSREQLWGFLEACNLPILPDGRFLAYKRVSNGYLDCHSRSIRNAVGDKVSMPRHQVNDDPTVTCSSGLHVCSKSYLNHFGGEYLMAVAVDPKDVVAVPTDYNNAKMRVCAYEVIEEIEHNQIEDIESRPVYGSPNEDEEDFDDEEEDITSTFNVELIALTNQGKVCYGKVTLNATDEDGAREMVADSLMPDNDDVIWTSLPLGATVADIDPDTIKVRSIN
jgi:hypothetical protein